jgi:hypothetical protein
MEVGQKVIFAWELENTWVTGGGLAKQTAIRAEMKYVHNKFYLDKSSIGIAPCYANVYLFGLLKIVTYEGVWRECIITITIFLDIVHRHNFNKNDVSETGISGKEIRTNSNNWAQCSIFNWERRQIIVSETSF